MIVAVCAIAFAFGFFGSMPLAGPIALMVFSRAAQKKYGQGLRIGLGAAVAEGFYAGGAFFGFTTLLARHPIVVPVSHAVTALLLVGLGIRFAVWKPSKRPASHERSAGTLFLGFSLSALNPTLLVTWSAAVAFLYSKGLGTASALVAIPFGVCAAVGVGLWFAILVFVFRKFEGKLPEHVFTWTIRVLGGALVGLGVWSGVQFVEWLHGDHRSPTQAAASLCSPSACDGPGDRARHRCCDRDA